MYTYKTEGVCSKLIDVELDGDKIVSVEFTGGCDGNLKAIGRLVQGQDVDSVIGILEGNRCGRRQTSCADQLAKALTKAKAVS